MVIVNIEGGFGNQLFSYAFGYSQAQRLGVPLWIDTSLQDSGLSRELEIDKLNIEYEKRISYPIRRDIFSRIIGNKLIQQKEIGWATPRFQEQVPFSYDCKLIEKIHKNVYYSGNWQNYRYFDRYRRELRRLFRPQIASPQGYYEVLEKIKMQKCASIHIRRGDYVQIGCTVNDRYYTEAIEISKNKLGELKYFVFTDDKEYAINLMEKMNVEYELVNYSQSNSTIEDFALMSSCTHHIIANSSYSWWAAYLGDEKSCVIAPVTGIWKPDFYMPSWHTINI